MIYLDYNSTTPVHPEVLDAMLPYFTKQFGNAASSTHAYGWQAREAVDVAREQVAGLINAHPSEIIFTSGSTQSINLAIRGFYSKNKSKGKHLLTTSTEHKAVLDTLDFLKGEGADVSAVQVSSNGKIDLKSLGNSIEPDTIFIAVMLANNETGVLNDIRSLVEIASSRGIAFLTDATQAAGKIPVDVKELGIDLLALSGHKMYGPKGSGALYIANRNPRIALDPLVFGGGHEKGLLSGTLNIPAIVGLGKACEIASREMESEEGPIRKLRNQLEAGLLKLGGISINGDQVERLYNTSNLAFEDVEATMLVETIQKEIAVATGSACTSANPAPSHVLRAMGFSKERIHSSVRFSLGKWTTSDEIDRTISVVSDRVKKLRDLKI